MTSTTAPAPDGPVAVLGAGSWGTALACSLAASGRAVRLWTLDPAHARDLAATRRNAPYLPMATLPEAIAPTSDLAEATRGAWLWIVAVPSQAVRSLSERLAAHLPESPPIVVSVAKGIETGTLLTTTAVLRDALPGLDSARTGVLYGPSHAEEVAVGQPTSLVVAMPDAEAAARVQDAFMAPALRVYANADVIGVEVGGSVKNVVALAAGMSDGLGLGDNAKAALVTRGLAEITRLGVALGADAQTFAGLTGLGDLVVTCFSRHSRNRGFGERIGRGESAEDALAASPMVVEGVATTASVRALAARHGVEMPIADAVAAILAGRLTPADAAAALMGRDARAETDAPEADRAEAGAGGEQA